MDASGMQSVDCTIFEVHVSVKVAHSGNKMKILLEKFYICKKRLSSPRAYVSCELPGISISTVLTNAFYCKAITVEPCI